MNQPQPLNRQATLDNRQKYGRPQNDVRQPPMPAEIIMPDIPNMRCPMCGRNQKPRRYQRGGRKDATGEVTVTCSSCGRNYKYCPPSVRVIEQRHENAPLPGAGGSTTIAGQCPAPPPASRPR